MTAPPGDRGQLDFLQHVQRIFDEGEFVATYKFALLIALVELAIERGDDTGAPLELDLHSIAEKFIEQYWPHAAPYGAADGRWTTACHGLYPIRYQGKFLEEWLLTG